jgi:cysteine dioxygenase
VAVNTSIADILADAERIASSPGRSLKALTDFARGIELSDDVLAELLQVDPERPYGRKVLHDSDHLEVMIARWTPNHPCAPHDHGRSSGVVRLLRGASDHVRWTVAEGQLQRAAEERVEAGDVMSCGPALVHSMGCAGAEEPLVTLHFYMGPIPHMMVYDLDEQHTYKVNGGCGAWIPHDQPELIEASAPGFHRTL